MSMLELTREELNEHDALTPSLNAITQRIVDAVPFPTVNKRMKSVIAVAQLTNFAAQFKRNVVLWDGTEVPINAISFIVTGSGNGKDSSVKAARKCFKPGFTMIEEHRKQVTIKQAINKATEAGEDLPSEYSVYKDYMKPIPPIDIMVTTEPGLIQHINDIGDLGISSGFLYSGEFSDELAYSQDMMTNIKVLSETYDLGDKEAKYTKGVEFRSSAISGQPISALFVGSPGHIIYDETTKKKFDIAFMSKLARRSWFCYAPELIPQPVFDSNDAMIDYEEALEVEAAQARAAMSNTIMDITRYGIKTLEEPINVPPEVFRLFKIYQRYNSDLIDSLPNQDSTYALIRRHLQWKALKLAGAYALYEKSDTVLVHHYVDAIRFCELLDKDMEHFEHELNKSNHERFSDYIRTLADTEGKALINIHDLKKKGFMVNVSPTKLQEFATLCVGYDPDGVYTTINENSAIGYQKIFKTDVIGISFKAIDNGPIETALASGDADALSNAKQAVAATVASGFTAADTTFAELGDMLSRDYAYSPFRFRDGIRGKDQIIGGAKWVVLDVDDTIMSAEEAHFMLSAFNHHIALSSSPDNQFKYRVLLELDSSVELNNKEWKRFYLAITEDLGLSVDALPQSQIFFSYKNRKTYSNLEADPICVRDYIIHAKETTPVSAPSTYTTPQKKSLLNDPLTTFVYAYEASLGTGSLNMFKMIKHAKDIGADLDTAISLIDDVNEYWATDKGSMSPQRIERIKEQATEIYQ